MTIRRASALVAFAFALAACATLPPLAHRAGTFALTGTHDTRIARALAPQVAARPGLTGVVALPNPHDALATRILLATAADKSIDLQYYIWHDDEAGAMLFDAVWQAARRGVRVRILLDDLNTEGLDAALSVLVAQPNVEVRLYNPFAQRDARLVAFAGDFARLNRRMHNKSFTVDNSVSVVGGRNIGNEYFAADSDVAFVDLDAMVVGAVVPEISREFDTYWNSASAYPAAALVGTAAPQDVERAMQSTAAKRAGADAAQFLQAVAGNAIVRDLLARDLAFEWTTARVMYDPPQKTLGETGGQHVLLFSQLIERLGAPALSLDIVSPYFVPGDAAVAAMTSLAQRGVRVRVLTNSLSSTDVAAVHAGYAKRRTELLRGGVRIFELKRTAAAEARERWGSLGSYSATGLHAKVLAVDEGRIFIGSLNFDQRSYLLNPEMGLVIDSEPLARAAARFFANEAPRLAYEVKLAPDGSLEWTDAAAPGVVYGVEPDTTWGQRAKVELLSLLPIDWLL
jgi:putative cardiolipin synthase